MTSANSNDFIILYRQSKKKFYKILSTVQVEDGRIFYVDERIAAGGNAVVHKCIEKLSGDIFAIKFQLEFRNHRIERFQREVALLESLSDPHIIKFIGRGTVPICETNYYKVQNSKDKRKKSEGEPKDIPFVILAKASENLAAYAKYPKKIPTAIYLQQFIGLANALVKINKKAIHRDIKPENILVVGDTWVISDFGLCDLNECGQDLTQDNERVGPVLWMSPEAFNKSLGCLDVIGETSDVFQLASVFWYAVCGRHPTGIVRETDWIGPSHLYNVIEKALLHNCSARFKSSESFRDALTKAIIR